MDWEHQWRQLSKRADRWLGTAETALGIELDLDSNYVRGVHQTMYPALLNEAQSIITAIQALTLPQSLTDAVAATNANAFPAATGQLGLWSLFIRLNALRIPLDNALLVSEEPRRRLVERAFLHLNRTLSVDEMVQARWIDEAFGDEGGGEPGCERLGALHLLAHGLYAFKADADSGRTDLILNEPLHLTDEVRSAEAMVLTEWKLVPDGRDQAERDRNAVTKAEDARRQLVRYAAVELAGIELRRHRYAVLVSRHAVHKPAEEHAGNAEIHYINLVIDPERPSREARRRSRERPDRPRAARAR